MPKLDRDMLTDIEIAQNAKAEKIEDIAAKVNLSEEILEPYGRYKAKVDYTAIKNREEKGRLILVTAINPTPEGEGKTTVSIGLADALALKGVKVSLALREPSLGPVFGLKGGATGGGYSQIIPMEDINLHFTGDMHAISAANNLIAAMIDNSIEHSNPLGIDPRRVYWRRCVDMNDRQLRFIVSGLGGKNNGTPREESFDITAASEIMATLCLAEDMADLKKRVSRLIVARKYSGGLVRVSDLNVTGAVCTLLKDAIKPNLVQTLGGTPAFVHGGPFANIAHGCNSIIATRTALKCSDIAITEAGFGADLGAEKFIDIKCRAMGVMPSAVILVASARVLKSHGGAAKDRLDEENLDALRKGLGNLGRHIKNIKEVWRLPLIVAINKFSSDTPREIELIEKYCESLDTEAICTDVWANGGKGGLSLASALLDLLGKGTGTPSFTYPDEMELRKKIEAVATKIYHASSVSYSPGVLKKLRKAEEEGFRDFPVCIAKTQYSFSDDPKKTGAPDDFTLTIKDIKVSAGAGFIVAYAGEILTMPGLPKTPAAERIDIDDSGRITGLS